MDLLEFLEEEVGELENFEILSKLHAGYGKEQGILFALLDSDGAVIDADNPLKDSAGDSLYFKKARAHVTSQNKYFFEHTGKDSYFLFVGVFLDGTLKGYVECLISEKDFCKTKNISFIEKNTVEPLVEFVGMYCRIYDQIKKNTMLETKIKHDSNSIDVLREQHHEIQSLNIRQREELEETNEQLSLKRKQLEDYGKNLEKKVDERTRELQRSKEKAEESDRFKSQFLANMSHEMRTPLNSIIGFVEMVLEDEVTKAHREYLEKVGRNSHLLLNLINDILDLSKLQANQMKVEYIPTSISKLFEDTEASAKSIIAKNEKHFEVRQNCSPEVSPYIFGDPKRLQQIMNNLVSNSVKFTDDGYIEYGVKFKDPQTLIFHVKDTGIGIPPEKHDLVFQSFQQADGSTTRKYGGTGLGLTITKNIIELMKGEIWIESQVGEGTTFFFSLPYKAAKRPDSDEQEHKKTPASKTSLPCEEFNILLVDDSIDNQLLAQTILKKQGYKIHAANDGFEAVDAFKENHETLNLVLMDIQMPRMGGLEATGLIREFEKEKKLNKTPIIALTAGAMEGDKQICLDAGCDGYLTKPINKKKLLDAVQEYSEAK